MQALGVVDFAGLWLLSGQAKQKMLVLRLPKPSVFWLPEACFVLK
jgi:hypothetical protein